MDYLWGDGVYDDRWPVVVLMRWQLRLLSWCYRRFFDLVGVFTYLEWGRPRALELSTRGLSGGELRRVLHGDEESIMREKCGGERRGGGGGGGADTLFL